MTDETEELREKVLAVLRRNERVEGRLLRFLKVRILKEQVAIPSDASPGLFCSSRPGREKKWAFEGPPPLREGHRSVPCSLGLRPGLPHILRPKGHRKVDHGEEPLVPNLLQNGCDPTIQPNILAADGGIDCALSGIPGNFTLSGYVARPDDHGDPVALC
jgi:hypothetical protein